MSHPTISRRPILQVSSLKDMFTSSQCYLEQAAASDHGFIAHIRAELEVTGLRKHVFELPVHTFVKVSVDDQRVETSVSLDTLNPKWTEPMRITARASSTIKFTLYRKHTTSLCVAGNRNHKCGEIVMELWQALLADSFTFHQLRCRLFSREVNIKLRVHIVLEPAFHRDLLLSHVGDRLVMLGTQYRRRNESSILGKVGASMEHLESILRLVDGIVGVHPMCKVAWVILGSVYKAFKSQQAVNRGCEALAEELRDTLAYAKACQDLKPLENASDVLLELVELVVQGASFLDSHVRKSGTVHGRIVSAVSQTSQKRMSECQMKLSKLKTDLHLNLSIRTYQIGV
ncbi:hypothetical protein BC629DRAFT_798088 [Irpex lacteus]|nr:hypothetical protein BC629DRAFT_798088 [Irpex lacteus]